MFAHDYFKGKRWSKTKLLSPLSDLVGKRACSSCLDLFKAHLTDIIKKQINNNEPLDIFVNCHFKVALRCYWHAWMCSISNAINRSEDDKIHRDFDEHVISEDEGTNNDNLKDNED
ncbi:11470_t:CDS:2 [Ambispora gerdemannii]|uniref:11470_t:CDS:1 n=1 Tax=Ambispora gerdemannii TaxID=144530 RepID=A0A9N9B260_9GLOM|nr:11470_t:CDS:2 [Ambispora gerdemannii]